MAVCEVIPQNLILKVSLVPICPLVGSTSFKMVTKWIELFYARMA